MAKTIKFRFDQGANLPKTVGGNFFLTDTGGSVVNGTVRITVVDDGSFLDIVNATSSTYNQIGYSGGITELDVTTSGSDYPTANNLFVTTVTDVTVDVDFPTITLTVQGTSETADSTASASFPTIVLTAQATDVTAAASFTTITLTVQSAQGQGNNQGNASFPTITLTVQAASALASSTAQAGFDYSITLIPPTVRINPDLRVDPPGYLGRFQRSDFLPFVQAFDHLPDAAPTLHIYRGLTLVASFQIPLIDSTINIFADELFLGEDYLDGHYVVVTTWAEDLSTQYKIDYFCVRGGTGRAPIHGVIEQRRPLGQAVISVDETGLSRMAYDPKVPA